MPGAQLPRRVRLAGAEVAHDDARDGDGHREHLVAWRQHVDDRRLQPERLQLGDRFGGLRLHGVGHREHHGRRDLHADRAPVVEIDLHVGVGQEVACLSLEEIGVQRQLGLTRSVEAAYVGSRGSSLITGRDLNQPRPSAQSPNLRPNFFFGDITILARTPPQFAGDSRNTRDGFRRDFLATS